MKIKDQKLILKIKDVFEAINEVFFEQLSENQIYKDESKTEYSAFFLDLMVEVYGDTVYKLIPKEQNNIDLSCGNILNICLLSNLYLKKTTDLKKIINSFDAELKDLFYGSYNEIFASIILSRFYALYCYPLDEIYNNNSVYQLDRSNQFDYSKLNLSELNPEILIMTTPELERINKELEILDKKEKGIIASINRHNKNISGILSRVILTEELNKKVEEFSKIVDDLNDALVTINEERLKYQEYYDKVATDYNENDAYFRNRAIIEGIRNSLLHGNVVIENNAETTDVSKLRLKFTNVYKNNICFQMTVSIYELESLFEKDNTDVISEYHGNKENKILTK